MDRMTVAIASYQRRDPLMRLLRLLDREFGASDELRRDVEVLVVLDGSTDGSREAVEATQWSVPTRVHWQPNRGLAAARNVGLEAAEGGLVWFLDDDLVPSAGLVARHRQGHQEATQSVLVGPCLIPPDMGAPAPLVRWWDDFYADLAADNLIDRFDRFTTANASAPAAVLSAVGGFDEAFATYGLEDFELGVRLLAAGTTLRFDPDAVAWHPDIPTMSVLVGRQRSLGVNAVRLAHLHPEAVDVLFPFEQDTLGRRILRGMRARDPRALMLVSRAALACSRLVGPALRSSARRAEHLARVAAFASGVSERDSEGRFLDRVLGYSSSAGDGRPRAVRSRRRDSRQPAIKPASNGKTISR